MDRSEKIKRTRLQRIFKHIAKGRKNALKEFYELYGAFIYAVAMTVCRKHDKSDYAVNEVLIKVWQSAEYLSGVKNFEGWLYRVTVNTTKDLVRADTWAELGDTVFAPDNYARLESDDAFFSLVDRLPPFEREICVYRFVSDMTLSEIAATTERPISTVASAYHRALDRLKGKIKKF